MKRCKYLMSCVSVCLVMAGGAYSQETEQTNQVTANPVTTNAVQPNPTPEIPTPADPVRTQPATRANPQSRKTSGAAPQSPAPAGFVSAGLLPTRSLEMRIFETPYVVNEYFVEKNRPQAVKFVSIHHDEQTGLRIAKEVIARRGGRLFELVSLREGLPERYLYFKFKDKEYRIDPNRFFTSAGITKDLRRRNCKPVAADSERTVFPVVRGVAPCGWERPPYEDFELVLPELQNFAETIAKMIEPEPEGGAIISVHNNTDRGFGLISYTQGGDEWRTSEKGIFYGKEDTDNFFLVTNEPLFKKLVDHDPATWDFNIVLQKPPPNIDDGSLSIYSGRAGWDYILVEAETYAGERQRQMINRLLDTFEKQE